MEYAVSCNGKLYIVPFSNKENEYEYEYIRNYLREKGVEDLNYFSYILIKGREYEKNNLDKEDPDKNLIYYGDYYKDGKIRREFKFPNKDIINLT